MKNYIWMIETYTNPTNYPSIVINRLNIEEKAYWGKTPLRCARILNMTLAMARRYEQSAYPKSATPDSPA